MEAGQVKGHLEGKPSNIKHVSSLSSSGSPSHSDTSEEGLLSNSSVKSQFDRNLSFGRPEVVSSPSAPPMGTYDPNRIPASVFSSKPTNPAEWSATSNESLFSIHMGNNSFSRDYAILFGKSGELARIDDLNGSTPNPFWMPGELPRLDEWNNNARPTSDQPKPSVVELSSHKETSDMSGKFSRVETEDDCKTPKVAPTASIENHNVKDKPIVDQPAPKMPNAQNVVSGETTPPTSPPRFSNESGNSGSSFAFPLLVNDGGKVGGSLKAVPEKSTEPPPQQLSPTLSQSQPQVDEETQKPPKTRRCPFFTCFPQCC